MGILNKVLYRHVGYAKTTRGWNYDQGIDHTGAEWVKTVLPKTEVRIFERNNKLYVEVPGIEWIKPKVPIKEVPIGDIYYI